MRSVRASILVASLALPGQASAADPDVVRVDAGLVRGTLGTTPRVRVFRGIPYAAPPVGADRWRAPRPAVRWEGIRAADAFGPQCMQPAGPGGGARAAVERPMSEDCLSLNVWTEADPGPDRRAVIVWLHGGAFTVGTGSTFDGEALARKGVVVVTCNYRLGPFGFFAHPELTTESGRNASGNYGLMDVLAVLRWVRDNIRAFGGDPDRVTLAGQSAGGGLAHAAVASVEAKNLFRRAISQSAPLRIERMLPLAEAEQRGLAEAAKMGARSLAALRARPAEEILRNLQGGRVIVDGWLVAEDASVAIDEGRQNRVDLLVGANRDEGTFVSSYPASSFYGLGTTTAPQFSARARERFGAKADAFLALYPAASDAEAQASERTAFTDEAAWSARHWAVAQAATGAAHVYLYHFVHRPPVGPGQPDRGATHGAEVRYVFADATPSWTDVDRTLAETVSSYWTSFAKTGDPNGAGRPA